MDFKNLTELRTFTKTSLIIDLAEHCSILVDEPIFDSLGPVPEGLYIPGVVDPIFTLECPKYFASDYYKLIHGDLSVTPLESLDKVLATKEDIVDSNGQIALAVNKLARMRRYMRDTPTTPINIIKLATYLSVRCMEDMGVRSITEIYPLDTNSLVENFNYKIYSSPEISPKFFKIYALIEDFIDEDLWCMYKVSLRDKTLFIDKGVDLRIYEWYEDRFLEEEKELTRQEFEYGRELSGEERRLEEMGLLTK